MSFYRTRLINKIKKWYIIFGYAVTRVTTVCRIEQGTDCSFKERKRYELDRVL
jgi:hypothetical protein